MYGDSSSPCCRCLQMSFGYIARAFGVLYLEFLHHYGETPSVTGGVGAVAQTATGLFGKNCVFTLTFAHTVIRPHIWYQTHTGAILLPLKQDRLFIVRGPKLTTCLNQGYQWKPGLISW